MSIKSKIHLIVERIISSKAKATRRKNKVELLSVVHQIEQLKIERGDAIFIHSMISSIGFMHGDLNEIIEVLIEKVGQEGHVFMPTFTSSGYSSDYLETKPVFDVNKTPSKMGVLTEIFRKRSDVVRSIHPTHSVAVWGKNKEYFINEHHTDKNPFGEKSPFYKFLKQSNTKVICLGVTIFPVTLFRVFESVNMSSYPLKIFLDKEYSCQAINKNGDVIEVRTLAHNPEVSGLRRNLLFENYFIDEGLLSSFEIGNSTSYMLITNRFYEIIEQEFHKGNLPYLNHYTDFDKYQVNMKRLFTIKS
jgi:aminoglycoside N3'-acetyltransferase